MSKTPFATSLAEHFNTPLVAALELCIRAIDLDGKLSDAERESAEIDAVRAATIAIRSAKGGE